MMSPPPHTHPVPFLHPSSWLHLAHGAWATTCKSLGATYRVALGVPTLDSHPDS